MGIGVSVGHLLLRLLLLANVAKLGGISHAHVGGNPFVSTKECPFSRDNHMQCQQSIRKETKRRSHA